MTLAKLHDIAESGLRDGLKQLGFDMTTEVCAVSQITPFTC